MGSVTTERPPEARTPDAASESDVKTFLVEPAMQIEDPLSTHGIVGVKWTGTDGNFYGDIIYMPPTVLKAFTKQFPKMVKARKKK